MSTHSNTESVKQITISTLLEMKRLSKPIVMVTAYDFPTAKIAEESGVDTILVGDSVAMTKLGYDSTLPVTMEEMLHHVKAVRRALKKTLLVADMPYLSYELDAKVAALNAGRFLKEGGAQAVKVEGGTSILPIVEELHKINVPVFGHLGLTPQAVNRFGGYKVQGRKPEEAKIILQEAKALESAGISALVLECVPDDLAKDITQTLSIPTIGIGAGINCDGQVLVSDDLLGINDRSKLKFVKRYAQLHSEMQKAFKEYCKEVRGREFPTPEHSFRSTP